jgi:hypothetical protein
MPIPLPARALLAGASLACASLLSGPAAAQTFSCPEIKAVLAEADRNFASLKGRQLKKETAEDFARANGLPAGKLDIKYQRLTHEAKKPLTGAAGGCQVVDGYLEDDEAKITQSSFECRYDPKSSAARITPALRKQLQGCAGGEVDPDSDNASLIIYVERVESGEGMRGVSVELEADAAAGATLSVRKSVCVRKTPDGCDDE